MNNIETPLVQELTIEADGAQLAARFYPPEGKVRAHLVLHPATGVPQRYYASFARWAVTQGIGVLTYDYRDFGASQNGPMRDSQATMTTWGVLDQSAAEKTLAELVPEGPLWMVGHSLGGLTFAFHQFSPRFTRIITVCAGSGHYSDHPWSYRPIALAFWFLLGPISTKVAGYLPGRKVMLGADLPAGVYWQWRRWCTSRDFYFPEIGNALPKANFKAYDAKIRILSVSDDVVIPPTCVRRYAAMFPTDCTEFKVLEPGQFDLPSLGHIEVFSKECAAAWPEILDLSVESQP